MSIDPVAAYRFLIAYPTFLKERALYLKQGGSEMAATWSFSSWPILADRRKESSNLGEYFWQDLYVAKRIIQENPERHVDVGSRIDGFIAHLACVRAVEIFDIRPLSANIENVTFTQWNLLQPRKDLEASSDCVSCLHTLEHIGLGRYGDPIDPDGWKKGIASLANLVRSGGGLWLSVPVGIQRIEFNAHRVFFPSTINNEAKLHDLTLVEFHYWYNQVLNQSDSFDDDFTQIAGVDYALGIFHFKKR